jgi:hypothetical protein
MTMPPEDLSRLVDEALSRLPSPRAPRTLRPRVMAAVAPPVTGHPWFTWGWPAQVAAVLVVGLLLAGFSWLEPRLLSGARDLVPDSLASMAAQFSTVAETGTAMGRVVQVTWSGVVLPIAKLVLLLTATLCTACAACLAALGRMTPGGVSQT